MNQPIGLIKLKDWTGCINALTTFDSKAHAFLTFSKSLLITVDAEIEDKVPALRGLPVYLE